MKTIKSVKSDQKNSDAEMITASKKETTASNGRIGAEESTQMADSKNSAKLTKKANEEFDLENFIKQYGGSGFFKKAKIIADNLPPFYHKHMIEYAMDLVWDLDEKHCPAESQREIRALISHIPAANDALEYIVENEKNEGYGSFIQRQKDIKDGKIKWEDAPDL